MRPTPTIARLLVPPELQGEGAPLAGVLAPLHPNQVMVPGQCPAVGQSQTVGVESENVGGVDHQDPMVPPPPAQLGHQEGSAAHRGSGGGGRCAAAAGAGARLALTQALQQVVGRCRSWLGQHKLLLLL